MQGLFGALLIATVVVPVARAATVTRDCNDGLIGGLTIAVAGLAVFDIATAPESARRYNAQHFTITPQLDPVRRSYGLSVSWNFGRRLHPPPPQKSPGRAFAYSLVSTTAPMALGFAIENEAGAVAVLSGVVLGPSVGHFYAGQEERALITLALRGAGTTVALAALVGCVDFS
jgi:hypothetical protein